VDLGAQGLAQARVLSTGPVRMEGSRVNPQLPLGLALQDSARFGNYFAGANLEAVRALQSCARGDGEPFVFLAGAHGLGKSHLLQATCLAASAAGRSVAYLPLADCSALSVGLLEGLEQLDLVCLDDVHAIAGQVAWEEGVFHLFNRLREAGGGLLASGLQRADRCQFFLADLASRLGWGVTYVLAPLPERDAAAALELRARGRGLELPAETAQYLLRRMPRDLPTLFRLLDRLDEAAMIEQRRLTVPFVKSVLERG
jgi:DnaA family protein